ncbi:MAG: DUF4364 family protein [Bacillota bacterium]|nr:DUF4364 family protein [Bacillota bacterium]
MGETDYAELGDQVSNQIIILHIVQQLPGITRDELMQLVLGTLYMDYFSFGILTERLVEDGLLYIGRRKNEPLTDAAGRALERCDLTERGLEVHEALISRLPLPVRRHLGELLRLKLAERGDSESVIAAYRPDEDGRFLVTLALHENIVPLIEVSLRVPDEHMARSSIRRWREHYLEIYPLLLRELIYGDNHGKAD